MKITVRRPNLIRIKTASRVAPRLTRTPVPTVRSALPVFVSPIHRAAIAAPSSASTNFSPDPYVDYARVLTPEGGVKLVYKDLDERLRHTLLRFFLWSSATALEAWILFAHRPALDLWFALACLLAVAIINAFIVAKPIEIYRAIEIRPDCMILEGSEIFWAHKMEAGWPAFRAGGDGSLLLSGVYGTRFVDYLTVRKFDELDRTPEVLASHLQDAMQQLWSWPHAS
jgi:hypothetical protein